MLLGQYRSFAVHGIPAGPGLELCRSLQRNGLNTAYIQFDGVTSALYIALRGKDMLPIKLKAVDNMRRVGYTSLVLVPTLTRGVNDNQVGSIVRFASGKLDIIKGINFQPVSFFSGRIDASERTEKRLTIPDFLSLQEKQTDNRITREDFYPVPFVGLVAKLIAAEMGAGPSRPSWPTHAAELRPISTSREEGSSPSPDFWMWRPSWTGSDGGWRILTAQAWASSR